MNLACAILLLAGADDPLAELQEFRSRWEIEPFVRLRSGIWGSRDFDFEATLPNLEPRRAKGDWVVSSGLDAGAIFPDNWALLLTYEFESSHEYFGHLGGAALGYRGRAEPDVSPGVPRETLVYAGVLWGTLEVHDSEFGDFDESYGFRAGLSLQWELHSTLMVSAAFEYRLMEWDYEEPVQSGDDQVGGSGIWLGVGLEYRF